jgi:hypothetical protein
VVGDSEAVIAREVVSQDPQQNDVRGETESVTNRGKSSRLS